MFKRPQFIAVALVSVVTLIILSLPHRTASQLKLAIGSLFLPLFGVSRAAGDLVREGGDTVMPRAELLKENRALRQTNAVLRLRAMQADGLTRENELLRQQLNWRQKQPLWNLRLANVVGHDPANWWQTIQIDLGSRDGMQTNLPVLSPAGLVGRIASVGPTTSQVVLVGNPNCKVAAVIEVSDKSHVNGVITGGAGPLNNTLVTLSYLSTASGLKPGQRVVTWGEGGIFPKGVVIGQVTEILRPADILYVEARVKLAVDAGGLDEVWVKMP